MVMDVKNRIKQRLIAEGRWRKFWQKRDKLKADGMTAPEAWEIACACFPPLDGSPPEIGKQLECNSHQRFITVDGETKTLQEWADEYGLTKQLIRDRINRNWTIEDAIVTPARKYRSSKEGATDGNPIGSEG